MKIESSADDAVIVMTRMFDAPRDVVWTVFTEPKHVVHWYGGHGFSSPVCEMDVRPGGLWRHTMRTPDGVDYAMQFVFVEVVKPEKLVWQRTDHDDPKPGAPPRVVTTVTLEEAGAQTSWKMVARFDSVADRDFSVKMGFTKMITEGAEKLDERAKSLAGR